ncbi:MAG TPA: hypothetical protein VGM22_25225 [Methylomirabilota bacterium]
MLVREAALRVMAPSVYDLAPQSWARHRLIRMRTDRLRAAAEIILRLEPPRRYWPPGP